MKYFIGIVISSLTIMHFSLFLVTRGIGGREKGKEIVKRSNLRQICAKANLASMFRQPLGVNVIDGWNGSNNK